MFTHKPKLKSFAIPYNNDSNFIETLLDSPALPYVLECYGNDGRFGSGRLIQVKSHSIIPIVQTLSDKGIGFNYLLNSISADEYWVKRNEIIEYIQLLVDHGVRTLTISHPFIARFIRDKGIEVEISSSANQFICSPRQAVDLEAIGYDRIMIDEDELRNLKLIISIRKATKYCSIEVLINNACLFRCPNRLSHQSFNRNSLSFRESQKASSFLRNYCIPIMNNNLKAFLDSNWIRPEDLSCYRSLGVNLFKITGRTMSTQAVMKALEIYSSEKHEGSILDYVRPERMFRGLHNHSWLTNKTVQPYLDHIFSGCDRVNCDKCESIIATITDFIPEGEKFKL